MHELGPLASNVLWVSSSRALASAIQNLCSYMVFKARGGSFDPAPGSEFVDVATIFNGESFVLGPHKVYREYGALQEDLAKAFELARRFFALTEQHRLSTNFEYLRTDLAARGMFIRALEKRKEDLQKEIKAIDRLLASPDADVRDAFIGYVCQDGPQSPEGLVMTVLANLSPVVCEILATGGKTEAHS